MMNTLHTLLSLLVALGLNSKCLMYNSYVLKGNENYIKRLFSLQSSLNDNSEMKAINRHDFPILSTDAYPNKPLIYLDSAASSQKPYVVLETLDNYYKTSNANVHRGAHALAMKATAKYENSRDQIQNFINAKHREEIIFTKGATEAINLVAQSYGQFIQSGDEIILSVMEHHSNLVPWQLLSQRTGAVLKFVELNPIDMTLDLEHYKSLLSSKTKIVALSYSSNVLGYVNPVSDIINEAHKYGAVVLLDACQAVPHLPVNVQELDVDFIVASGHKMCGPTGKLPLTHGFGYSTDYCY